ncbi:Signal transduction histidine kinase [Lachnospiraceae bacterium XBB1006]|nr:Signal transduction histidine kinase [Lachnospiraceae bacterium XBB1006]
MFIAVANVYLFRYQQNTNHRMYRVEISRIVYRMEEGQALKNIDLADYPDIVSVKPFVPGADERYDSMVEEVNGKLYRFSYREKNALQNLRVMNSIFGGILILTIGFLWGMGRKLVRPFVNIRNLPSELAKGNLTVPIPEEKSKFFGQFLWGMDMLREKLEEDRTRELALLRERKTLILSLSHDVKTPLSAIELYGKALKSGLYDTAEKQGAAVDGIEKNVAEIKDYVNAIVDASRNDVMSFEVKDGEVYLHAILKEIQTYYADRLKQMRTQFLVQEVENCLVRGDMDRIVEVFQNVMENAIKYSDGQSIAIAFAEEEDCKLVQVTNTGCGIGEEELPHLFDSFYRGSNSEKVAGSGLGLYICKELMHRMDGEIFAKMVDGGFQITVVLRKV